MAGAAAHLKHIFFFADTLGPPLIINATSPLSLSKDFSYLTRAGVNKKQILLVQLDSCVGILS